MTMKREVIKTGRFTREAVIVREHIEEDSRVVELAFSSETPVERWFGDEILDHDASSVRMERLSSGRAPLLMDHNYRDQVGVIEKASIDSDKKGRATVRFGKSSRAEEIFDDVKDGIRACVSFGYAIYRMVVEEISEDDGEVRRALDWEPLEISMVSVPADITVGLGRTQDGDAEFETIIERRASDMPKKTDNDTGDDDGTNVDTLERTAAAKPGVDIEAIKDEVRGAEKKRVEQIRTLAAEHDAGKVADSAIEQGLTIEQFRGLLAVLADRDLSAPFGTTQAELGLDDKEVKRYSLFNAIRALRTGNWDDAGLERECSRELAERYDVEPDGILLPHDVLSRTPWGPPMAQRDQSTLTDAAGGFLVGTDHRDDMYIDALRARTVIMELGARLMTGLEGNVDIPRLTTSALMYWLAEGGDTTESNLVFSNIAMSPKTVSARVDMTRRLLAQSSPYAEALVRDDLMKQIAREIDRVAIEGLAANDEPNGILNTAGIGAVAMGVDGLAIDWAAAVNLETEVAVDNADVGNLAYLTTPQARGSAKQILKSAGVAGYIWDGNEVNGYRTATSTLVPADGTKGIGTDLSTMIYGNFADIILGQWGVIDLKADETTLGDSGGLVLRAFLDIDVAIRHAESFSAVTDLVTS